MSMRVKALFVAIAAGLLVESVVLAQNRTTDVAKTYPATAVNSSESAKKYSVGALGELQLKTPTGWRDAIKPSPIFGAPTIEITPPSGNRFRIVITVIPKNSQKSQLSNLKSALEQISAPIVAQSVEKKADLKLLKGEQVEGYYYSVTDPAPAPGEYTYVTHGLTSVGDVLLNFTIFSNDAKQKVRDIGLELMRSALHLKAQANAQNSNASAATVFNGAPLRPPKRFERLQLTGIMGTKQRPMVIINNQSLSVGETARVKLKDGEITVVCKEIRPKSAIVLVQGSQAPVEIFLASDK